MSIILKVDRRGKPKASTFSSRKDGDRRCKICFPNACETKIVFTMNARSLINFFRNRCCERAQWEIREMAVEMLHQVKKVAPNLFQYAGPACLKGNCPEGKMSCGKIKEIREKFLGNIKEE